MTSEIANPPYVIPGPYTCNACLDKGRINQAHSDEEPPRWVPCPFINKPWHRPLGANGPPGNAVEPKE